jgi:hypothetical protein
MTQRTELILTDDLAGSDIPPGKGETVTFALDGKAYEIDLTIRNSNALRKVLAPYIAAARPVRNRRGRHVSRVQVGPDTRAIKEWARGNGYEVADRGRIPNDVRQAFEAAH